MAFSTFSVTNLSNGKAERYVTSSPPNGPPLWEPFVGPNQHTGVAGTRVDVPLPGGSMYTDIAMSPSQEITSADCQIDRSGVPVITNQF